jgi:hypothetical protein
VVKRERGSLGGVRRRGRWRKSETLELNSDDFLVTLVSSALFHIIILYYTC